MAVAVEVQVGSRVGVLVGTGVAVFVGTLVGVFVGTAVGVSVGLGQSSYVTTSCGRELVVVAGVLPNKGWLLKDANESGGGAEFVPVQ